MTRPGWRQPVKMADAVSATLQRLGLEGRVRQHDIWRVWPSVVGHQIARHAQPHSISQGRLIVHVTDSVWLHHLSMMRHRLVAALNEQLKPAEIREMFLRVGEVPVTSVCSSPEPASSPPLRGVEPTRIAEIERALAPLGDAPFREALRQLWLRASQESASTVNSPGKPRSR